MDNISFVSSLKEDRKTLADIWYWTAKIGELPTRGRYSEAIQVYNKFGLGHPQTMEIGTQSVVPAGWQTPEESKLPQFGTFIRLEDPQQEGSVPLTSIEGAKTTDINKERFTEEEHAEAIASHEGSALELLKFENWWEFEQGDGFP